MPRPNVLFFFTDDQRYDTIAALGNPHIHTPNMDRLVARGTAFTHAFIPCGTSAAVCMPSRAMLNTGRTLFHITGAGESISPQHATIGQALRQGGYRTFGAGKWHNGMESYHRSFTDGAEIFYGGMSDHWNVPAFDYDPAGKYDKRLPIVDDPWKSNAVRQRHGDHIHSGRHSTETIGDAAIAFIHSYDSEQPFYMYVSLLAPHDPRTMPQKYLDMYRPQDIPLPANFLHGHPFNNGELQIRDEMLAAFPRNPDEIRRHLAEYYAMISHLDDKLGQIVEALSQRGLLDNTIIVLAGDNGLALGQHGLMGKQSCYDHSVRVPLVFVGPGVPVGRRTDAFAYLLDIFPTLCDLTGTPVPASVEGRSLAKTIAGGPAVRENLYFAYTDKHRAIRDRRYKLIEYVVEGRHTMTQLFDLQADPCEMHNLAADAAHAGTLHRLRAELIAHRDDWGDTVSPWGKTFWDACKI